MQSSYSKEVRKHCGASEEQKLAAYVRQACKPQVQVRKQEVLGRGLLCLDRRAERGHDREVQYIREQEVVDIAPDKLSVKEYEDPFGRK